MDLPRGVTWDGEWRVEGVPEWYRCAWSGDGAWLLAGGGRAGGAMFGPNGRVVRNKVWGEDVTWSSALAGFVAVIVGDVAVLPAGKSSGTSTSFGGSTNSLATRPDSVGWAAGGSSGALSFSDRRSITEAHGERLILGVALDPTGRRLLSAGWDKTLRLWDTTTLEPLARCNGPHGAQLPLRARWLPLDSTWITSGDDGALAIWSPELVEQRRVQLGLEAAGLEIHPTLPLIACHGSTEVALLRTDTWAVVARWQTGGVKNDLWPPLALHPTEPLLIARGPDAASLGRYRLDLENLLRTVRRPKQDRRFQAGKVVLLGRSGVGKTGLGWVLAGQEWRATDSTHRRLVHPLGRTEGADRGAPVTRETVLWDLAGQPSYRLVHHLHLRDVALALLVVDATTEADPLADARYWSRALDRAARADEVDAPPALLVCARSDVGPVRLSADRLLEEARALGALGVLHTSAKEGTNIPELRAAIAAAIRWDRVPIVHSDAAYAGVRDLVSALQSEGALLLPTDALRARHRAIPNATRLDDDTFTGCLRSLDGAGALRWLGPVGLWLLQPEALDALAGALVHAAQGEPDGLGSIAEARALSADFPIPKDTGVPDPATRKTLLRAAVEELVSAEVAFRAETEEGTFLVFPTASTRTLDDLPDEHTPLGKFRFGGATVNLYATLVVRLAHSGTLGTPALYRDAAVLPATVGSGELVVRYAPTSDGDATLTLLSRGVTPGVLSVVEAFVARHLRNRARPGSVSFRRAVACPGCGLAIPDQAVRQRRANGKTDVACSGCDVRFPLPPEAPGVPETLGVDQMGASADAARNRQSAALRLDARRKEGRFDAFLCYNSRDRKPARELHDRLTAAGLYVWVDWDQIRPGDSEIGKMEAILGKVQAAVVLLGPHGLGPWQDEERKSLLRAAKQRSCRIIPVTLPGWEEAQLPPLLADSSRVDLRPDRDHPEDPFDRLVRVLEEPG